MCSLIVPVNILLLWYMCDDGILFELNSVRQSSGPCGVVEWHTGKLLPYCTGCSRKARLKHEQWSYANHLYRTTTTTWNQKAYANFKEIAIDFSFCTTFLHWCAYYCRMHFVGTVFYNCVIADRCTLRRSL